MPVLDYAEIILFLVILFGYIPVIQSYRVYKKAKLFFWGYTLLLVGILATNLETIILPDVMPLVEHGIGIMIVGIIFAVYAFKNYKDVTFLQERMEVFSREGKKK